ncbi:unnamed protein product [Mytilus edulis]|uniref:Uncharacterized protein n=1 Tax=Mytilus edulis TaxID=6550 RepID=A0A8S3Q2A8_MYTED|nr:unnamed protein product [Mytilus edulis]
MLKELPKECNFVLDQHLETTHIATKKQRRKVQKTPEKIQRLPLAKKRKLQWSGRQDTVPLEVTEEGIDIYFEEQGEGCAHRPPQDDQQDAPGEGCAHRPPQDDQQDAPGEGCAHRPPQDVPEEGCAHRPPQEDKSTHGVHIGKPGEEKLG